MKTILTTLAIALMVFAFSANPVMAGGEGADAYECQGPTDPHCIPDTFTEAEDLDEVESEVADSGDEGHSSAAQESDQ